MDSYEQLELYLKANNDSTYESEPLVVGSDEVVQLNGARLWLIQHKQVGMATFAQFVTFRKLTKQNGEEPKVFGVMRPLTDGRFEVLLNFKVFLKLNKACQAEIIKFFMFKIPLGHCSGRMQKLVARYGKEIAALAGQIVISQSLVVTELLDNGIVLPVPELFGFPRGKTTDVYCKMLEEAGEQDGNHPKPNPKPNPDVQEVQDNRGIARMDEVAGLNDNTADKLDQQTKQLVQQVEEKLNNMGQSLKTQGNMPSEASEFIESLNRPPKVKWTRILRGAFAKAKSRRREKNPTRPARRPPIKVPGGEKYNFYKGDLVRKNQTTVLLVVDTSGSMGAKELRCVEAEAKYMTNNGATVMIMQVDASVAHDPVEFKAFSKLNNFFGRGGTSFIPAFEAAENMRPWPSMMVYFTDGYGTAPANPPSFPVLWLLTSTGMNANDFKARVASWGDVAVVDVED